jgi:hypothetical protein
MTPLAALAAVMLSGACVSAPAPVSPSPLAPRPSSPNDSLAAVWRLGRPFAQFAAAVDHRVELWRRVQGYATVPDALVTRARRVGPWKLLIVADDDCSDSANVIPYIAKLAELAPNLELRIVYDTLPGAQHVKDTHRSPDGRAAIPTLVVLNAAFEDRGCWVERPAQLQQWYVTRGHDVDDDTYRREKLGFYDFDHGSTTLEEVVGVLEAAAAGTPSCGIAPRPW